jgi:hypothetical protein
VAIKTRGTAISSLLVSLNFTSNNSTMKIIEKFALLDNAESVIYIDDRLTGNGNGLDIQVNSTA